VTTNSNATGTGSSPLRNHVRAADTILQAADAHGLRLPFNITATDDRLKFQFMSLDELTEWATWAEAVITSKADVEGEGIHHTATGTVFDQAIDLAAFVPTPCRCRHAKRAHQPVVGCDTYVGAGGTCRCASYSPAPEAVPA